MVLIIIINKKTWLFETGEYHLAMHQDYSDWILPVFSSQRGRAWRRVVGHVTWISRGSLQLHITIPSGLVPWNSSMFSLSNGICCLPRYLLWITYDLTRLILMPCWFCSTVSSASLIKIKLFGKHNYAGVINWQFIIIICKHLYYPSHPYSSLHPCRIIMDAIG